MSIFLVSEKSRLLPAPNFGSPNMYFIKHIEIAPHSMLRVFVLLKIQRGLLELYFLIYLPMINSFNCPSPVTFSFGHTGSYFPDQESNPAPQ